MYSAACEQASYKELLRFHNEWIRTVLLFHIFCIKFFYFFKYKCCYDDEVVCIKNKRTIKYTYMLYSSVPILFPNFNIGFLISKLIQAHSYCIYIAFVNHLCMSAKVNCCDQYLSIVCVRRAIVVLMNCCRNAFQIILGN